MTSCIVLGNAELAYGMRFCGIKESHIITSRAEGEKILPLLQKNDFLIVSVSVMALLPELYEFKSLVTLPDNVEEFSKIDDLKHIIKSAIGIDIEVV